MADRYFLTLARYSAWANERLYDACAELAVCKALGVAFPDGLRETNIIVIWIAEEREDGLFVVQPPVLDRFIYVYVTGTGSEYRIHGWVYGWQLMTRPRCARGDRPAGR